MYINTYKEIRDNSVKKMRHWRILIASYCDLHSTVDDDDNKLFLNDVNSIISIL